MGDATTRVPTKEGSGDSVSKLDDETDRSDAPGGSGGAEDPPPDPGGCESAIEPGEALKLWEALDAIHAQTKDLDLLVADLGRAIRKMALDLVQEVRTEKLTVVDSTGRERIATRTTESSSTLEVLAPGSGPRTPAAAALEATNGENWRSAALGEQLRPQAAAAVRAWALAGESINEDAVWMVATTDEPPLLLIEDHRCGSTPAARFEWPDGAGVSTDGVELLGE